MRNRMILSLVAILAAAMAGIIPGAAPAQSNLLKDEGWSGSDAYRFVEYGIAAKTLADEDKRQDSACRAAVLAAQFKALEKLADAGIKSVSGTVNVTKYLNTIQTEVSGYVHGKVIKKEYHPAESKCWVVYEIREPGLKQKVLSVVQKYAE